MDTTPKHAVKTRPNYLRQLAVEYGHTRAANLLGLAQSTVTEALRTDTVRLAYEQAAELHYARLNGDLPKAAELHRLIVVRAQPGVEFDAIKAVLKGLGVKYVEFTDG